MTRYSDPFRCPECQAHLPVSCVSCPTCRLPLQGPLARRLFLTLQTADTILGELRAERSLDEASATTTPPAPMSPAAVAVRPARTGLRAASVPTILLGLGALCLLVAAVTFLAVAWSWLGVGGRTVVLVALTLASTGSATVLGGRGLRVAAESLTTVALGLLVLDLVGADHAGWLGDPGLPGFVCLVGGSVATVSLAMSLLPSRLVVPQLAAAGGAWFLVAGSLGLDALADHESRVFVAGVLAFTALAWVARTGHLAVLGWATLAGAGSWWLALLMSGLEEAADHLALRALWLEGHGWALLTAAALLLLPVAFAGRRSPWSVLCGAGAATLASLALALPAVDAGTTRLTLVALLFLLAWSAVAALTPVRLRAVPGGPMCVAAVPVGLVAVALLVQGASTVLMVGAPFSRDSQVRLEPVDLVADPRLLVPCLLGLVLAALSVVPPTAPRLWARVGAAVLVVGGTGTVALLPVPLWAVVAALLLVAVGLVADSLSRTGDRGFAQATAGLLAAGLAVVAALPSDVLTAVTAGLLGALAGAVVARADASESRTLGRLVLPATVGLTLWSAASAGGVLASHRALPILLVCGLIAVVAPRFEVELSGAAAGLLSSLVSISSATDLSGSLALHLTVAGVLVSASALVNPSRRDLGWLGGLLLALASWVRLADAGVGTPEAYTLPSAVVLLALGLLRLWRTPQTATSRTIGPALALATAPSLLWVLAGPAVSLRAALLGVACLVLVLVGSRLRWSSPLVVGAGVGGVLVLRELAPYAAETPQWVLIGLAGTLLTVVGVTWERRLRDLQYAATYLGRLR